MAYISFKPSDYFKTKLYTGTGSSNAITGVGFQPDFTWIKNRDASDNHMLFDAVRGVTKFIHSNLTTAETTQAESLKTFDSDGFTVGTYGDVNTNTEDFASWNWKAGTTSGISGGTITPSSYSINTTSKIGIYKWSGTGTAGTIAHGLGVTPTMMIVKDLTSTGAWQVYHEAIGATKAIYLNDTAAAGVTSGPWNDTAPTTTTFALNNSDRTNGSGKDYIAYVFAPVKGYSAIGSYTGNASATDGPFIYTGFRPAFILAKASTFAAAWTLYDHTILGYNADNKQFDVNSAGTPGNYKSDIYSNGFKPFTADGQINGSYPYIYIAFADQPIVGSDGTPGVAR